MPRQVPPTYQLDEVTGELRGGGVLPTSSLDLFLTAWGEAYMPSNARARLLAALAPFDTIPFPNLLGLLLHHVAA